MRLLLEDDGDIEASDKTGNTSLLLAVNHGHKEVVRMLLKNEADIVENGQTALHSGTRFNSATTSESRGRD